MADPDFDRLDALIKRFEAEVLDEQLSHDCWVTLKWWKGRGDGPPDEAYGPYDNLGDALKQAKFLRDNHMSTPASRVLWSGYPTAIDVVAVYKEDAP